VDPEDAFNDWKGLSKVTEEEAAHFILSVGGQGILKCNCKGECMTNSCACKKLVGFAALGVTGTANAARAAMRSGRHFHSVRIKCNNRFLLSTKIPSIV
jgi:hypothetical protein